MKVRVLRVGSGRCDWADAAVAEWRKRLARLGVEEVAVDAEPFRGEANAVRAAEGGRLLRHVRPRDRLVALDVRGSVVDTDGFARLVQDGRRDCALVFALGGAYGHGDALRAAAWRTVCLSPLVLAHDVARVLLWEQLYRAWAIETGSPYHTPG